MPSDFAVFTRAPVRVRVGGRDFRIPYRSAAEWAAGLERLNFLVAYLADEDTREQLVDLRVADPRVRDEIREESLRILEEQGGRKWWEVGRLLSTSADTEVLGRLVLAGADPHSRSLGEWCAAVFALCVKDQDEKGRMKFEFMLSLPPPGYEQQWDDGNDIAALEAAYARHLGK